MVMKAGGGARSSRSKPAGEILAGACSVRTVLDVLGADALTVSDRALWHGLIADRFGT
jgi:exopolyphosphatase / guanosine-5'-triphosphate,3'-diphosphate pyrophosphatase